MGKYFNGVAVAGLEAAGDLERVCIGGSVGYMMRQYLLDSREAAVFPAQPVATVSNPYVNVQGLFEGSGINVG